jgi:hypothetical protein
MVFKIALSVLVLIAVLLIFAASRPDTFRVQRSVTIYAAREKVFCFVNDLHCWEAWSGENGGDRSVQRIYSGPGSGTGAVAEWHGSGRAGAAKMMITESVVPSKVAVKVDWFKPFEAHNLNEFSVRPQGESTELVWSIQASNRYAMKVIGIFVNMEAEFGKHMETGLKNLKSAAEAKETECRVAKRSG